MNEIGTNIQFRKLIENDGERDTLNKHTFWLLRFQRSSKVNRKALE